MALSYYRLPPRLPLNRPPVSLSFFGLASLTTIVFPSSCPPLNFSIACFASSSEDISTNPNPLDSPVNLSLMIFTDRTLPAPAKFDLRSSSVTLLDRFPMYNFLFIFPLLYGYLDRRSENGKRHPASGIYGGASF